MSLSEVHEGAPGTERGSSNARIPLIMVQKTMAKRMTQSAQEVPQFSVSTDLDVVVAFFKTMKQSLA